MPPIYKVDPVAKVIAKLVDLAIKWRRAMADHRCAQCGTRVHRAPEEVALAEQVGIFERLVAKRPRRFESSEAPTRKRGIVGR